MTRPKVNIHVKGGLTATQQRKTVLLKPDISITEQMQDENTRYVVRWDFEIPERTYLFGVKTSGATTVDGVSYSFCILEAVVDQVVELVDPTLNFVRNSVLLNNRTLEMHAGNTIMLCSLAVGNHEDGIRCTNRSLSVPKNCEIIFDGGSITGGGISLDNTRVLPVYNDLVNDGLTIMGNAKAGTIWWNEKLLISNGEGWVDALGNDPATGYEIVEEEQSPI